MNFKVLVENIINEKDLYTVRDLKGYRIWETNIKNLPIIKKEIKKDGLYSAGVRVLVPVFETKDNEITDKIKELININGDNIVKTIRELRDWAKNNITPERKKELGYEDDDTFVVNSTQPGLGLALAKTLVESYSKGFLVAPLRSFTGHRLTSYVFNLRDKLNSSIINVEYKDFVKISNWRKIDVYKEFHQFNDKEVEQEWGDIISEL